MNKRGQFFLIAAFIVAALLISLTIVYNTANVPKSSTYIYDLSSEINLESSKVIDNGVFTGNSEEIFSRISNLSDYYSKINPDSDFIIIYGDKGKLYSFNYTSEDSGSVSLDLGGLDAGSAIYSREVNKETYKPLDSSSDVSVSFSNFSYDFKLKDGQNFFLVIRKESGDEQIVASS